MDKILQFLQLLLILEVVSSRECYLKPLPDKWCDIQGKILFDPTRTFETFKCPKKSCVSITFFSGPEFKTYFKDEIINKTIEKIFIYEDQKIQKNETAKLEDYFTEENLALVNKGDDLLVIRNKTGKVTVTSEGQSNFLYFGVIDNNRQYIIRRVQDGDEVWRLIDVAKDNEFLQIVQSKSTILLMNNKTVYKFGDALENICISQRSSNKFKCSESQSLKAISPRRFIREGKTFVDFGLTLPKYEAFFWSGSEEIKCETNKNSTGCLIPKWSKEENVSLTIVTEKGVMHKGKFTYLENPEIVNISSTHFYDWTNYTTNCTTNHVTHACNESGKTLVVQGQNFNNVVSISITPEELFECPFRNDTVIHCQMIKYRQSSEATLYLDTFLVNFTYTLHDSPHFRNVNMVDDFKTLEVYGERLNLAATRDDYRITVNEEDCSVSSLNKDKLECHLNSSDSNERKPPNYNITIILQQRIFHLKYETKKSISMFLAIMIAVGVISLLILTLVCFVLLKYLKKRKTKYGIDTHLTMAIYKEPDVVERNCTNDGTEIHVPFQKMTQYIERILLIDKPRGYRKNPGGKKLPFDVQEKLGHFEVLLKNKFFILNVIKAMERKKNICHNESYELSLHLCLLLSLNLGFLLELCEELFKDLIHHTKEKERKKIMSGFDSIAESIIKNWLALSMYPYIKFKFEPLLLDFVNEVRHFLTQGPVDEVTGNSQYHFFKSCSISKPIDYRKINVQLVYKGRRVQVPVLSCDSISQLKTKYLVAYQAENIGSVLLSPENIQIVYDGYVLNDYMENTDSNGCSLVATVDTYNIKDGDQLYIEKVAKATTDNTETRYVTLGASVNVAPKEINKPCHLVAGEKRKALSMNDISHMKLPSRLEVLLLKLFSKMLDQDNVPPPLQYLHTFFIHQASKFSLNDGGKLTINSYVIQMCSQFISHPNILLDIPIDLCVQKNLSTLQLYIKEALLHPKSISSKSSQVGKDIYGMVSTFISQLNEQPELDKNVVIKSLQEASALYTNGITIYKDISLYSLVRIMENNYVVVYKALENDQTARKLCLHEKFSNIFH